MRAPRCCERRFELRKPPGLSGIVTSLNRANGAGTTYAYDHVSRLTSLTHNLNGAAYDVTKTFTTTRRSTPVPGTLY